MNELHDVLAGCGKDGEVVLAAPICNLVSKLCSEFSVKPAKGDIKNIGRGGALYSVKFLRAVIAKVPKNYQLEEESPVEDAVSEAPAA